MNDTTATRIRVLVVDDHPMTQAGLRNFMRASPDLTLVGMVDSGEEAIDFCDQQEPDVVLMDLLMPGIGGIAATRAIKERHPNVRIIALTSSEESDTIREELEAHATGYLFKSATAFELAYAIRSAMQGRSVLSEEADKALVANGRNARKSQVQKSDSIDELTDRELEVLRLVASGLTNKKISEQLSIELPTVKFHLRNLFIKLSAAGRSQLIARAYHLNLLSVPDGR